MTRKDVLRHCGIWGGLLVAAVAYFPRFAKDSVGMTLYPQAAECVLQGAPLNPCAKMFSYPPVFAFLMTPFAAMPMGLRVAVWYVISVAATVGCFMISEKLVLRLLPGRWSDNELAWLRIGSIILSIKFVLAVFEWQAYDTLTYFIVLVGLWAVVVNRAVWGAILLAFATAIKATPLVFLPYLVVKRRFLAAGIFIVIFVALWLLPDVYWALKNMSPHYLATWLRQIAGPALANQDNPDALFWTSWAGANILNHSFTGMVARMVVDTSAAAHGKAILYGLCAVYIAIVGLLLLRSRRRDDFAAVDGSILVISMLMLSPMTSRYHYILLVLPYMTVVGLAVRDSSLRIAAIVTVVASFILGTATSNDLSGEFLTNWSYAHNFLNYSALVLLAFLAYVILRNEVRQAQPALA
jgi:Glycosyltransferase family 87